MNPYRPIVSGFARLVKDGKNLPLGDFPRPPKSKPAPDAPVAVIFSPHPDDECIIGGFALRLMREDGWRIVNVAVTLGSNPKRRQPRWRELRRACDWLGFELEPTAPDGLEKINAATRAKEPQRWARAVKAVAGLLSRHQPRAIFFPHEQDWHPTHIGTHHLVLDALKTLPRFRCHLVETEFWGQMASPNLMLESNVDDVADLMAALTFHAGEVRRNPYHLRLPAWLQDNVRRGAEWIGGQGADAPDFIYATLYRVRQWKNGKVKDLFKRGKQIGARESVMGVFRS